MNDHPIASPPAADSGSRLSRVQEILDDNESLRRKRTATSMVGVILLLAVLSLFGYRLYLHGQSLVDQGPVIAEKVWQEVEPALSREGELLAKDLKEKAIPELSQAMIARFKADLPKFEEEAHAMGDRLLAHSRQTVEARLIETLSNSLEKMESDLQATFPEFSAARIDDQLSASRDLFQDKAYEVIEERIARVTSSLEGLKMSVAKVADSRGKDQLSVQRLDWAEDEVISALVDLMVYELKPELGAELVPAAPADGGAK